MRVGVAARALALAILGGVALAAIGCAEEAPPAPEVARPVKIFEVGSAGPTAMREYPGTIRSEAEAEIAFEVAGRVIEFPVDEGQELDAGALVARLDARDYQAALDKALAQLENQRAEFERAEKLLAEGVLAESERDSRETAFRVAQADVRTARKAVDDATLRTPVPGRVARKLVRIGESVQAKQPVLIFQSDEAGRGMEIEIAVPEREIAAASPDRTNDEVTALVRPVVRLEAMPDRPMDARISEFATSPDPATRTFKVTLRFQAPEDLQVLPGMTATVAIHSPDVLEAETGGPGGLTIPSTTVVSDDTGAAFVWKIDRSAMTASRAPVELGPLLGDSVLVRSGLAPGDWIAMSGVHQLREGMEVTRLER